MKYSASRNDSSLTLPTWRCPQNAFHRKPEPEQFRVAADGTVDFESDRQAARRHTREQRQPGNAGVAAGIGVADHGLERRHRLVAIDRHLARSLVRVDN